MTRVAVITQPTYLPWLGYFQQMLRADVFVVLDSVQFEKQSWQSRNRLKGRDGEVFWLAVPIAKHSLDTPLRDICIAPQERRWREKHLRSIQSALGSAPFFHQLFPEVEAWLRTPYERLAEMNLAGITLIANWLGVTAKFVRASELRTGGSKAELVANICREIEANHYLANAGSRDYIEQDKHCFDIAGVSVEFQNWPHPVYPQQGREFVSHLPAIDALMNLGVEATKSMITAKPATREADE